MKPLRPCILAALLLFGGCAKHSLMVAEFQPAGIAVPLEASARFDSPMIAESSGIVTSRQHEGVFWTHNDSGDSARIFPVRRDGTLIVPTWLRDPSIYQGMELPDAANIDWEDIAADSDGNLYIGAFGNNGNTRQDLGIYVVREPNPYEVRGTRVAALLRFHFEDQTEFPPVARDFDCEALFHAHGDLYVMTKQRGTDAAALYRLEGRDPLGMNVMRRVGVLHGASMVTAADATPDGSRLAVLSYTGIWVFTAQRPGRWFEGTLRHLQISAGQCEAITFIDDNTLLITNEEGELFEVIVDELTEMER